MTLKATCLLIPCLCLSAMARCLPVTSDRIFGSDLVLADARFAAVPASLAVASAPVPGTARIFTAAELTRLAQAHGIQLIEPAEVCFSIPMRNVSAEEVAAALRRSLPAGVMVSVVDQTGTEVPAGELVFPLTGLSPVAGNDRNEQLWRGYVKYTETRRAPFWARVNITQKVSALIPVKDLAFNVPIDPSALRTMPWSGPLLREPVALRIEEAAGRIPKKTIKAGAPIALSLLDQLPTVRRGDAVRVEVLCGHARLQFDALAERPARNGEMVELRNPATGRTFRAKLDGARAVVMVAAGPQL